MSRMTPHNRKVPPTPKKGAGVSEAVKCCYGHPVDIYQCPITGNYRVVCRDPHCWSGPKSAFKRGAVSAWNRVMAPPEEPGR